MSISMQRKSEHTSDMPIITFPFLRAIAKLGHEEECDFAERPRAGPRGLTCPGPEGLRPPGRALEGLASPSWPSGPGPGPKKLLFMMLYNRFC